MANTPDGDPYRQVGDAIRKNRETIRSSKADAARRAHISPTTWIKLERGQFHRSTDDTIVRAALAVHLDPDWAMGVLGRPWDSARYSVDVDALAPLVDGVPARPTDPLALAYENKLVEVIDENPLLDARARAFLLEAYRLMIQRRI